MNPNSYENIKTVLRNIGEECGISRYCDNPTEADRQWILTVCDGLPMSLIINLIHDSLICGHCKEAVTASALTKHYKDNHHGMERVITWEFDWLLPRLGSGHYEMQMVKTFFDIMWVPSLHALCYVMGFQSDTALASAKRCANHHKAWKLLLMYFIGTMKELVRPYVIKCISENTQPSPDAYFSYAGEKDEVYQQHFEMVFRFAISIIMFRMAIRRNNHHLAWSAKFKFRELIHARNHPKYQLLEIYDSLLREMAPTDVKEFVDSHVSMSRSGNESLGEDLDFILEEENRRTKKLLPPGVPTDLRWEVICRNISDLHIIRESHHSMLGTDSELASKSNLILTSNILLSPHILISTFLQYSKMSLFSEIHFSTMIRVTSTSV